MSQIYIENSIKLHTLNIENIIIKDKQDLTFPIIKAKIISSPIIAILGPFEIYVTDYIYLLFKSQLPKSMINFINNNNYENKDLNRIFFEDCKKYAYKSYPFGCYNFGGSEKAYKKILKMPCLEKIIFIDNCYATQSKTISYKELLDYLKSLD